MRTILLLAVSGLLLTACATPRGRHVQARSSYPVRARPVIQARKNHALYDGRTGRPTTIDAFVARARTADLVAFGELHGHPVGAVFQRDVLSGLAASARPVALAMEFFEADHQETLDEYLRWDVTEGAMREQTNRNGEYPHTHAPLVMWARVNGMPVIAANAPRRLVSAYRKTEGTYAEYLASLSAEERALLPSKTTVIEDAYYDRFVQMMGPRGAAFFRSQALWDDAMAESMAEHRDAHASHRLFFIVGGFHVTDGLGTLTKYKLRRPGDRIVTIAMSMGDDDDLSFTDEDRGTADVVLKVRPPKRQPRAANPHARPAPAAPADAPTEAPDVPPEDTAPDA